MSARQKQILVDAQPVIKLKKKNNTKRGDVPFYEKLGPGELGLVHIYTGHGKGKTTASIGLAIRAIGQGFRVCIIQFLKGGSYTGEFVASKEIISKLEIHQFGKECVKSAKQLKLFGFSNGNVVRNSRFCGDCRYCFKIDDEEKIAAQKGLSLASKKTSSGDYDVVILDEVCAAINQGLLDIKEVLKLIKNKYKKTELILTGRDAPKELIKVADYVSDVKSIRHPFDKGVEARRGIEY